MLEVQLQTIQTKSCCYTEKMAMAIVSFGSLEQPSCVNQGERQGYRVAVIPTLLSRRVGNVRTQSEETCVFIMRHLRSTLKVRRKLKVNSIGHGGLSDRILFAIGCHTTGFQNRYCPHSNLLVKEIEAETDCRTRIPLREV